MTILACDLRILAADTLTTAGDIKLGNRSKIRIIKQHAIASTGTENDGFNFEKWFFSQKSEPFIVEESFGAIIMTKTTVLLGETLDDSTELRKMWEPLKKVSMGCQSAAAAAEALMRFSKFNAHNAAVAAANYHTACGEPVYSITKAQLDAIHQDFDGYWIGTYQTPIKDIPKFLITHKQWLKTS